MSDGTYKTTRYLVPSSEDFDADDVDEAAATTTAEDALEDDTATGVEAVEKEAGALVLTAAAELEAARLVDVEYTTGATELLLTGVEE